MNQKGVTIAALVVTIIVVLILGVVSFSVGFQLMDYSRVRNSITVLSLTRAEAEKIFEQFATETTRDFEHMTNINQISTDSAYDYLKLKDKGALDSWSQNTTLTEIFYDIDDISADEMSMLVEEDALIIDGNDAPQRCLWFKWSPEALSILKLDYQKLLTDSSKNYIYINYYNGEVILPCGVKSDTGDMFYSLTGLENADWIETDV